MGFGHAAKAGEDPNGFVAIIHSTHFTYVDGSTPAAARVSLMKVLAELEQGSTQKISLFKK